MGFVKKYGVELFFIVAFIILAIKVNLQFLEASNINLVISGHDEYLTIKEVNAILHPISSKHLLLSLISGDVFFYGRVMFYTDAAVAFIPDKIWGISGMVLAVRMFHAGLLILGLSILSSVYLKERMAKIMFFIASLTVAHTFYFTMLPKPEPHQLFFLALFLYYFKKRNWSFGKHFIWLGLAFGAKFNLLVVLPLLFIVPIVLNGKLEVKANFKKGIASIVWFFFGFFIAVPSLLLSPFKPIYFNAYINANLKNTTKAYDDMSIGITDWLGTGLGDVYFGWKFAGFIFVVVLTVMAIYMLFKYKSEKNIESLLLILIGIILMLVIAVKVKRIWPHYLWTGYIFASLGFISFIFSQQKHIIKYVFLTLSSCFIIAATVKFFVTNYSKYALAEKVVDIQQAKSDGKAAIDYIKCKYPKGINVATDGTLMYPFSDFVIANPYHPFSSKRPEYPETKFQWYMYNLETIWESNSDVIVFYNKQPVKNFDKIKESHPSNYEQIKADFVRHVNMDFRLDTVFGKAEIYSRIGLQK